MEEAHPRSLAFLLDDRRISGFRTGFEKAMVRRLAAGASRMPTPGGARLLAGCGFGLTPAGDDFVAGTLVALNVLQALTGRDLRGTIKDICAAAEGENLLSNAFLRLSRDGKATEKARDLVAAMFGRGVSAVRESARRLLDVGETSGADWMTGFVMTAEKGVMERWSDGVVGRTNRVRRSHPSSTPTLRHSTVALEGSP